MLWAQKLWIQILEVEHCSPPTHVLQCLLKCPATTEDLWYGRANGRTHAWWRAKCCAYRRKQKEQLKKAMADENKEALREAVQKSMEEMRQKQKDDYNSGARGSNEGNNCK